MPVYDVTKFVLRLQNAPPLSYECYVLQWPCIDNDFCLNYVLLKKLVSDACLVALLAAFFLGGCIESFNTGLFVLTSVSGCFCSSSLLAVSLSYTFSVTIVDIKKSYKCLSWWKISQAKNLIRQLVNLDRKRVVFY